MIQNASSNLPLVKMCGYFICWNLSDSKNWPARRPYLVKKKKGKGCPCV
jgi:hypothetical protein